MSAKLIFKMEFYKFLNDKKYLIIAIVLGVANFLLTLSLVDKMNSSYYGYYGSSSSTASSLLGMSAIMSVIFLFIYPFHALAIDYKNNVMALMMASGVNRTKLYFSKIGATLVSAFLLLLIVVVIPVFLLSLRYGSLSDFGEIFESLLWGFDYMGVSSILYFIYMILSYLSVIVIINMVVIFTKGSSAKSVLLFFGIQIAMSILTSSILNSFFDSYWMDANDLIINNIIIYSIMIVGFGLLSLRQLKTQNL